MRLFAIAVLLVSSVAAASDDHLVGWSRDGSFYALLGDTCVQDSVQLCPSSKTVEPTWPAAYGTSDDGSCISSDSVEALHSLDERALAKLAPVKGVAAPAGIKVTVAKTGAVTVTKGTQKLTFTIDDADGAELDDVLWRPDGKAVAVRVSTTHHEACRSEIDHMVGVFDVSAFPANAKDLNVAGMRALKTNDYPAATKAFQDAIKADPTYLVAYYNLASVTSIAGDLAASRMAIEHLYTESAPAAHKMIVQSKTDPDLDFASTDPQVRVVMGVGTYPADATKRLTERHGVWSSEGPCEGQTDATIQLTFGKAGKLTVVAFCKGAKGAVNSEKWTPGKLTLSQAPLLGDGELNISWIRCPGSEVDGSCFQVGDRVFHRGVPHGK